MVFRSDQKKLTRMVGGQLVKENEYPFVASIQHDNKHICTGSIIGSKAILTAASCFYLNDTTKISTYSLMVSGGSSFWRYGDKYEVDRLIIHPQFDYETKINDIAIIKISKTISLISSVIIKLLSTQIPDNQTVVDGLTFGWGHSIYSGHPIESPSEQLNSLKTKTVPARVCLLEYQTFGENQICLASTEGKGICHGDVGGPLIIQPSAIFLQIGISSYGGACNSTKPEVYTRISSYHDWIDIVLKKGLDNSEEIKLPTQDKKKKRRKNNKY
nr:chymotrypsin-2-like [Onthophagus taurus]